MDVLMLGIKIKLNGCIEKTDILQISERPNY